MARVQIADLFHNHRFPRDVLQVILLACYFPLGLLLAVIRIFIGFHVFILASVLPKLSLVRSVVLRCMCSVLGIWVSKKGSQNRDSSCKVYIANSTSALDHLAVELVLPNVMPCVWDLPSTLMWLLGYADFGVKQGREVLIRTTKKHCQEEKLPVLVFPEGASTNGKVGLLKYSVWPFSMGLSVQPLIVTLSRPYIARLSPSILGSRWWIDTFWFLFVPYTYFNINVLPVEKPEIGESFEEYANRVQQLMAKKLGVALTPYTSADKVEYAKRKLLEDRQPSNYSAVRSNNNRPSSMASPLLSGNDSISRMALQVKEVLPHVPIPAIMQDLALTKDVDLTITNILEGRVEFTPEDPVSPSPSGGNSAASSAPTTPPSRMSTAAAVFSRNFKDRHLSLEERKRALIENARIVYKKKHGML